MNRSAERSAARRSGSLATRTVRVPIPDGVLDTTGEAVPAEVLAQRFRWLDGIVAPEIRRRIAEVWAAKAVTAILESKGHAYVAMGRVYGDLPWPPDGIHASDRVRRMAEEGAGRALRSSSRQLSIIDAILPHMSPIAVWENLSAADRQKSHLPWPAGAVYVERRNALRAVRNAEKLLGRLPSDAYDVVACPSSEDGYSVCPLDAADEQQVRLDGNRLSVLLPTCERPTRGEWAWHTMTLVLHDYAQRQYGSGTLCRPALRITPEAIYLLVPVDVAAPEIAFDAVDRLFAVDWGERRALTGAVVERAGDGAITTGRPSYFDASELQAKQYRRREEAEHLRDMADRIDGHLRHRYDPALAVRRDLLLRAKDFIWHKISECNNQLDYAEALWAVENAKAEGAGIAMEDLDSLEGRGHGRRVNGRVSSQPRGSTQGKIIDRAHLDGVPVVFVPPANTSALCSRCLRPSHHQQAPDRPGGNPNWLVCECGRSSDRDHSGAEAIGALALDYEPFPSPKASRKPRRGRKNPPVAGPASRRKIKVRHDRRRSIQTSPIPQYEQRSHTPRSSKRIPSRRVDRGSVVASAITMPAERRTPTPPRSILGPRLLSREPRALDGLAGGYWRGIEVM